MADIFSFGMLMFEIISRRDVGKLIPRSVANNFAINEAEVRTRLPKDCPKVGFFPFGSFAGSNFLNSTLLNWRSFA